LRIKEFQGSLMPKKCNFGFEESPLLGLVVFKDGLKVDEAKV
jgi:hypothetical protein